MGQMNFKDVGESVPLLVLRESDGYGAWLGRDTDEKGGQGYYLLADPFLMTPDMAMTMAEALINWAKAQKGE